MNRMILFGTSILIIRYFLLIRSDNDKDDYQINSNTLGLTFSPTGSLFMYSHGIAAYLEDKFDLKNVIFAGNSGGCQAAFFLASGIGMDAGLNKWYLPMMKDINNDNLRHPFLTTSFKRSKRYLGRLVNQDMVNNLYNRLFLVVTHFPFFRSIIFSKYDDFDDLFYIIQGTQYIPFIFGWPLALHKWKLICDGWLSCKIHKPVKNIKWLRLDPFKWKRFKSSDGLRSFKHFHDIDYNLELRNLGYQDAEKNHQEFIKFGLTEKFF